MKSIQIYEYSMVSIQTKTDIYIHIKTISYKRQTYICIENVMHIQTILLAPKELYT